MGAFHTLKFPSLVTPLFWGLTVILALQGAITHAQELHHAIADSKKSEKDIIKELKKKKIHWIGWHKGKFPFKKSRVHDYQEKDEKGETLLHLAIKHQRYKLANYLLSKGADLLSVNKRGESPLAYLKDMKKLEVQKGHFQDAFDYYQKETRNVGPVSLDSLLEFFTQVNFSEPQEPGYISTTDRTDDGKVYSPDELYERLNRLIGKVRAKKNVNGVENGDSSYFDDYRRKLDLVTFLLPKADEKTRNQALVDLAHSEVHCMARQMDQVTLLEGQLTTDFSQVKTFPSQLSQSLKNLRKNLLEHFNTSPEKEKAHGRAYWLHLLGQEVGIPEAKKFREFSWVNEATLGRNWDLSRDQALQYFNERLYTQKRIIEHIRDNLNNSQEAHPDYKMDFGLFYDWLSERKIDPALVFDEDFKVTDQGVVLILMTMGNRKHFSFKE